jgi:hypothetical protein
MPLSRRKISSETAAMKAAILLLQVLVIGLAVIVAAQL